MHHLAYQMQSISTDSMRGQVITSTNQIRLFVRDTFSDSPFDAIKRSGISRRITPHDIHRTAATHLHLSGMQHKHLQDILGYNSLYITRLYILDDEIEIYRSHCRATY